MAGLGGLAGLQSTLDDLEEHVSGLAGQLTKFKELNHSRLASPEPGTQFTCFTGTKVRILTTEELIHTRLPPPGARLLYQGSIKALLRLY